MAGFSPKDFRMRLGSCGTLAEATKAALSMMTMMLMMLVL
jgi:hypothetical protein